MCSMHLNICYLKSVLLPLWNKLHSTTGCCTQISKRRSCPSEKWFAKNCSKIDLLPIGFQCAWFNIILTIISHWGVIGWGINLCYYRVKNIIVTLVTIGGHCCDLPLNKCLISFLALRVVKLNIVGNNFM